MKFIYSSLFLISCLVIFLLFRKVYKKLFESHKKINFRDKKYELNQFRRVEIKD